MYKVTYFLTDGTVVSVDVDFDEYYKEGIEQFYFETRKVIETGGTIQVKKRTITGFPETTVINAKNITKIKWVKLDDKVTENN